MNYMKQSKPVNATSIDGLTSASEIAAHWRNHFSGIFNVHVDKTHRDCRHRIVSSELELFISAEDVEKAVKKLHGKKAPGFDGICEEHVMYAPGCVIAHLARLFTFMLRHGYIPDYLTVGIVVPIVKDKLGDISDSAKYRGITLSSIFCKILELVIVEKCEESLLTSNLQFGFKLRHSTTMCTFMVREIAEYFNVRGSPVYMCFLDASKDFDRINHDILFDILERNGLNAILLRLLEYWYKNMKLRVRWCHVLSKEFNVSNGVRQGGILSPLLFTVYINDLLVQLSHSGHGCSIGRCCVGAVGYADDICIMSASASGLQSLLDICFAFAESNDLMFNHKKTKCMRFVTGACRWMCHLPVPELFLGDSILEFVDQCTHLGHVIQSDLGHASAIDAELKRFFRSFNSFFHVFRGASPFVLCRLLKAHSSTFYGCQLWCWNKCDLNRISVGWNNAVRRICGVGKRTSVGIMLHASELLPLVDIVRKRKLQFMSSLLESSNEVIKYVSSVLQMSTRSSFFSSIREIELLYGVSSRDSSWAVRSAINDFVSSSMSEDDTVRVDIATDWMRRPMYVCRGVLSVLFFRD